MSDPWSMFSAAKTIVEEVKKRTSDKHNTECLEEIRLLEGCGHIQSCYEVMLANERINATNLAAKGNTCWLTTNNIWVYHGQSDFGPLHVKVLFRPEAGRTDGGRGWKEMRPPVEGKPCRKCAAQYEANEELRKKQVFR